MRREPPMSGRAKRRVLLVAKVAASVEVEGGEHPMADEGAKRDPMDGRPANWFSVDYETVRAVAETCIEGDSRYGLENWCKGLPASGLVNHAMEHLFKFLAGDTSEQHLEHAIWNLGKIRWMAKNKPEFIDLPALRKYFGTGEATNWPNKPAPVMRLNLTGTTGNIQFTDTSSKLVCNTCHHPADEHRTGTCVHHMPGFGIHSPDGVIRCGCSKFDGPLPPKQG